MKYSIGYQLPDEYDSTSELVSDYREHISSVYFSAPGHVSARSVIDRKDTEQMLEELSYIKRELEIPLVLLYNANCYGDTAVSDKFEKEIVENVGSMITRVGITDITTTSPFVAKIVKREFPEIKVCASVNMWIGTEQAMEYLGEDFDGFYMQREYNRDFKKIKRLSSWCKEHGKTLKLLANSGCLYSCPFHSFHDNLVAHEQGASKETNAMSKNPSPCWDLMYSKDTVEAATTFLQESWIRPEDMKHYEPYFSEAKLATRMHSHPRRVVSAYIRGRFPGNMLDLTEPSFSRRFSKHILDATKFPNDWFERTTSCSKDCERCGYCAEVAKQALVSKEELDKMFFSKMCISNNG